MADLLATVQDIADNLLFPNAIEVDRAGKVPDSHWQALADAGLYGVAAPPDAGGPNLQFPEIVEGLEIMASGCLTTTFTWIQHHAVVMSMATTSNAALRDVYLQDLAAGRVRAGVAFAGVIPDPPRMHAEKVDGGWRLTGHAPFVSGWGIVDVLQVSAGDRANGDIVGALIDAKDQDGFARLELFDLVACDGSNTVTFELADMFVPDERIASVVPREAFLAGQLFGARLNGTLPMGVTRRCITLLENSGQTDAAQQLRAELDAVRAKLDAGLADPPTLMLARADASQLALRAAAALMTAGGGPSLVRDSHAQRLAREALFTLVAASRAELKAALFERFVSGT